MFENPVISAYSKFDLRRLWPVVSTTLYPETEKRVKNAREDVRRMLPGKTHEQDEVNLLEGMDRLELLLGQHFRKVEEIVAQRLSIHQFDGKKFTAGYFSNACDELSLSRAEIKSAWNYVHTMSRRCFGKSNSTPEEKLALAKMNAVEQDILYVLFVEHHYVCPLIQKGTD